MLEQCAAVEEPKTEAAPESECEQDAEKEEATEDN